MSSRETATGVGIRPRVSLAALTSLGVGGEAEWFASVATEHELRGALAWARQRQLPVLVLGGGSNIVVSDSGVSGLVIQLRLRGIHWDTSSQGVVTASAGEPWDDFVAATVERGLAGLECLSGIPGLVGATPIQNVGAYGQEVSQTIEAVQCWDTAEARSCEISGPECEFAYRSSRFKTHDTRRFVVTAVRYRLTPNAGASVMYPELTAALGDEHPSLVKVRQLVLQLRAAKSMVTSATDPNCRSCGSFFVNPVIPEAQLQSIGARFGSVPHYPTDQRRVKVPAAWLIEQAGFAKGTRRGTVGTSSKHALALVCHEGACAQDVLSLAAEIRTRVWERFGVALEPEPQFVGFSPEQLAPLLAAP